MAARNSNLYRLVINVGSNDKPNFVPIMVYATSVPNARTMFADARITCELATGLQIMDHGRKSLPVIGEPSPPRSEPADVAAQPGAEQ